MAEGAQEGNQVVLADLAGQTLVKQPGDINGESVTLRNLIDCRLVSEPLSRLAAHLPLLHPTHQTRPLCSVFILDHSSEVEVHNCRNCQLFIGARGVTAVIHSACQPSLPCNRCLNRRCRPLAPRRPRGWSRHLRGLLQLPGGCGVPAVSGQVLQRR